MAGERAPSQTLNARRPAVLADVIRRGRRPQPIEHIRAWRVAARNAKPRPVSIAFAEYRYLSGRRVKMPTYSSWLHMKERCLNPNHVRYHRCGGRGITICDRWLNSFAAFFTDMGARPEGKTLDRIDNDKGYEPGNCRWATPREQALNQAKRLRRPRAPREPRQLGSLLNQKLPGHPMAHIVAYLYRRTGWGRYQIAKAADVPKTMVGLCLAQMKRTEAIHA